MTTTTRFTPADMDASAMTPTFACNGFHTYEAGRCTRCTIAEPGGQVAPTGERKELSLYDTVEHADWCTRRHGPAYIDDERLVVRAPLSWQGKRHLALRSAVLDYLLDDMAERGLEVVRVIRPRWNANGEMVGPEVLLRSCEAERYHRALQRVFASIEQTGADAEGRAQKAKLPDDRAAMNAKEVRR
jgi:hypothetical protein